MAEDDGLRVVLFQWLKDVLGGATSHTMRIEGSLAVEKHTRKFMGTASDAGVKASCSSRLNRPFEMVDDWMSMSPKIMELLDPFFRKQLSEMKTYDQLSQAKCDASEATRKLRSMEKETHAAAKVWANARVWYECALLDVAIVVKDLRANEVGIVGVFLEQISIVVVGYGFTDLAYHQTAPLVEKERAIACPVCGYNYVASPCRDDYLNHRVKHIKAVHTKLRDRGGKPDACPDPQLKVCRLCVIDEDQSVNPIDELQREQGKKATALVESGRVKATIERVGEAVAPEVNDALIGRTLQYVCTINQKGSKKTERYAYAGRILSMTVHDFILTPPDKLSQSKRQNDKKKSAKKRGKRRK